MDAEVVCWLSDLGHVRLACASDRLDSWRHSLMFRPLVKIEYQKNYFLISQPKHVAGT